jgi:hypothetical protein
MEPFILWLFFVILEKSWEICALAALRTASGREWGAGKHPPRKRPRPNCDATMELATVRATKAKKFSSLLSALWSLGNAETLWPGAHATKCRPAQVLHWTTGSSCGNDEEREGGEPAKSTKVGKT